MDVAQEYGKMERLVDSVVWKFIKKYGGEFEEKRADANLSFVKVCNSFDPAKGKFSTYVAMGVWQDLLEENRRLAQRLNKTGTWLRGDSLENVAKKEQNQSFVQDLLAELSEDAKTVVQLCLETPAELAQIMEDKGGQPRNIRSTVKQYLANMGWVASRISESFQEVSEILS